MGPVGQTAQYVYECECVCPKRVTENPNVETQIARNESRNVPFFKGGPPLDQLFGRLLVYFADERVFFQFERMNQLIPQGKDPTLAKETSQSTESDF